MMRRKVLLTVVAAAITLLLATAAGAYDWKIWVSIDGNAPPGGYSPDYTTNSINDAIAYIDSVIKAGAPTTPPNDSVEVWIDAGEYFEWNGFWWSGFNHIHNLYVHGRSSDASQTIMNGNLQTEQNNAYEEHTLMFWDIHNGRVQDMTFRGGRIGEIIDPAKKRAWRTRADYVQIDSSGTKWSVYTSDGALIAGNIALGASLTGTKAEDQQPAGVGLGSGGWLRVNSGNANDIRYFNVVTWEDRDLRFYEGNDTVSAEGKTGSFTIDGIGDGYDVIIRCTSMFDDPDWYDFYTQIEFNNCTFDNAGGGLYVRDVMNSVGGPNGEKAEIAVNNCTFKNLRKQGALFSWSNGSFNNCTFDTIGRNYPYSDYYDSWGNQDQGNGILFEGNNGVYAPAPDYGPFTMSVQNCDFAHVREADDDYMPSDTIVMVDGWDDPWWTGSYSDVLVDDCTFTDCCKAVRLADQSMDGQGFGQFTVTNCMATGLTANGFTMELNGQPGVMEDIVVLDANIEDGWLGSAALYVGGYWEKENWQKGAPINVKDVFIENMNTGVLTNQTANVTVEDVMCRDCGASGDFWTADLRVGGYGGTWGDYSSTVVKRFCSINPGSTGMYMQTYENPPNYPDKGPILIEDSAFIGAAYNAIAVVDEVNSSDQLIFRNCTIGHTDPGNLGDGISLWGNNDCTIDNCIVFDCDENGLALWGGTFEVDLSYTDFWNNLEGDIYDPNSAVIYGSGVIFEDPLFVNPSCDRGDYHLTGESPCVDAGTGRSDSETDWDGEVRVAFGVVDMGADEHYPIATAAPDPEPGSQAALFGQPQGGFPGWVWFSIPLTPDCPVGAGCADPNTLLGFNCGGSLFYWDKYGKFAQVYQPPFVKWDLSVGNSYLLRLGSPVTNPSYEGLTPFTQKEYFEFKLGKMGWTWVGMPGLTPLTGDDFMQSVLVKYPSDASGVYRSADEDYALTPANWMAWSWSFWDTYLQAAKTFTPYAPFGNKTCYPWLGYRVWVKTGTATSDSDPDQVTLIWRPQ
jgi:parallel beta-helix repeat protein